MYIFICTYLRAHTHTHITVMHVHTQSRSCTHTGTRTHVHANTHLAWIHMHEIFSWHPSAGKCEACCHTTATGIVRPNDVAVGWVISPHRLHDVVCVHSACILVLSTDTSQWWTPSRHLSAYPTRELSWLFHWSFAVTFTSSKLVILRPGVPTSLSLWLPSVVDGRCRSPP